jgi:hypothetical protein
MDLWQQYPSMETDIPIRRVDYVQYNGKTHTLNLGHNAIFCANLRLAITGASDTLYATLHTPQHWILESKEATPQSQLHFNTRFPTFRGNVLSVYT